MTENARSARVRVQEGIVNGSKMGDGEGLGLGLGFSLGLGFGEEDQRSKKLKMERGSRLVFFSYFERIEEPLGFGNRREMKDRMEEKEIRVRD